MTPERTRLDVLVDSVSDGIAVDWEAADGTAANAPEHGRIRALREVARIAEFNRGLQRTPAGVAPAATGLARWGDLLLLEQVGAGTRGAVWRAWDARLQREVALKLLHP